MNISHAALASRLSHMDLFGSVPEPILLRLAEKSDMIRVAAGQTIFHKNDPGDALYVILKGEVKVHEGDFVVGQMTDGHCFGELALLDEGPRSMSVTALAPTLLARIERDLFFDVLGSHPEVMQKIVGMLTRRLRTQTDQRVEQHRQREEELTVLVNDRTRELTLQKEEAEKQRAKAESEKRQAEFHRQRAEQSERSEQQFLANMSHEIRTPMNAVMGMTNLLLQKNPRPEQLSYLESIRKSSQALLVILNDILDISKIQAGRMELENTNLYISEILEGVFTTLQFRAEEKGLILKTVASPDIPSVLVGDPVRLHQVLLNLAGNAVKFTEQGSVEVSVRLLEKTDQNCCLRFEVKDTGIGMTAEQMAVVFDSFRQASGDTTRKYGGTGLGLSISRQLVEMFGGTLEVKSTPGEGSVFAFDVKLPIGAPHAKPEGNDLADAAELLRGLRILIAEDNEFNRIIAVETLELLLPGLMIRTVENGKEALERVQLEPFDVILMDISMPVMSGLEATTAIRALSSPVSQIPIIAFTASVTKRELGICAKAGMNACVPKPFKESELLRALLEVVTGAREKGFYEQAKQENLRTDYLEQLTGGNRERIRKYVGLFIDSMTSSLPAIESASAASDWDGLRRAVHTVKPQFRMMGMAGTADLAQEIETLVLEGSAHEKIPDKVKRLMEEARQAIPDLETYLQSGQI
jgi:signal transduction histidine kinase/HPt (histidine-containing phosphotransfer) domain-containing protein/AmiR/NasT family two-component response regulator